VNRVLGGESYVTTSSPELPSEKSRLHPLILDSIYIGGLCFAIPYLLLSGKRGQVFDHIPRRSKDLPPRLGNKRCLWVHGVSVGEILSARHFLGRFSEEFPDWEIVLSTTTRAGLEIGRRYYPDVQIVSYPFDVSYLVKRAFERIRPDLVLIVEHELWPNFLWHAHSRRVPVAIVNGRMSERSLRGYKWLSRLVTWPPPGIVSICVEDSVSGEGFRKLGVAPERIHVTGNFKFDNTAHGVSGVREDLGLNGGDWVLVGASTHKGEEDMLLDSFAALHREDSRSRLVIAPRHVERVDELATLVRRRGFNALRWSHLTTNGNGVASGDNGGEPKSSSPTSWQQNGRAEVLLVDTMGDLDRVSAAGDVVFVGGSLVPFGGHNVISPAGIGCPVVIGPHYANFRSVVSAFLHRDALLVARDAGDLSRKIRELKRDPGRARGIARRASETVATHAGASDRTFDVIQPLIQSIIR